MTPYRPSRPCPGKGKKYHSCPNLIRGSERYCPDCQAVADKESAKYDQARDQMEERQWIHSPRWRRASKAFLDEHPLCAECERQGRTTAAILVHHSVPHCGNYELFWNEDNWRSSCGPCHEAVHKHERRRK